jgi:hypothetical protein
MDDGAGDRTADTPGSRGGGGDGEISMGGVIAEGGDGAEGSDGAAGSRPIDEESIRRELRDQFLAHQHAQQIAAAGAFTQSPFAHPSFFPFGAAPGMGLTHPPVFNVGVGSLGFGGFGAAGGSSAGVPGAGVPGAFGAAGSAAGSAAAGNDHRVPFGASQAPIGSRLGGGNGGAGGNTDAVLQQLAAQLQQVQQQMQRLESAAAGAASNRAARASSVGSGVGRARGSPQPWARGSPPAADIDDRGSVAPPSVAPSMASWLSELLGQRDPLLHYREGRQHLSAEWSAAIESKGSTLQPSSYHELNTLLGVGRQNQELAAILADLLDGPDPDTHARAEEALARNAETERDLLERLNWFQLRAGGHDAAAASAIVSAAAFAQRSESDMATVGGLPIACEHMRRLIEDFKKRNIAKALSDIHDAPSGKATKNAKPHDDDALQKLQDQLDKERARTKKLETRLSQAGRGDGGGGAKGGKSGGGGGGGGGGGKKDDKKKKDDSSPSGGDAP